MYLAGGKELIRIVFDFRLCSVPTQICICFSSLQCQNKTVMMVMGVIELPNLFLWTHVPHNLQVLNLEWVMINLETKNGFVFEIRGPLPPISKSRTTLFNFFALNQFFSVFSIPVYRYNSFNIQTRGHKTTGQR